MIKTLPLIALLVMFSVVSYSQAEDQIKYFDENYKRIPESIFESKRKKMGLLSIQGDSINHKILSFRGFKGNIQNRSLLDSLLTASTGRYIDASKTLVIIYYPGKDACNSSTSATVSSRKSWFDRLEKKLLKITNTKPIYIYKDSEGIEKYGGIMNWHKDPEATIEGLFFKYHYPCSSFVVISKDGDFISSFGEYTKEAVWNAAKRLEKL